MPQKASLPKSCTKGGTGQLPMTESQGIRPDMNRPSPLDDPETAAHAWARFRRIMRFMMMATVLVVILALAALYAKNGMVSIQSTTSVALSRGSP